MNEIDATPRDLHSDIEKLKYYTQLYQTYALGNKIIQAESCINKIKANHPILSRV